MKISQQAAKKVLYQAYDVAQAPKAIECSHADFINFVLYNTHLTYKYVMFTAILSKSTDLSINPLCLQVKSKLPGAYDARSICHKVIVPFEMSVLNKALGGSNEPYLNKPARFPELSKGNAVRKGNDQVILNSLCDNLPSISSEEEAFNCLVYLLQRLIIRRDSQSKLTEVIIVNNRNKTILLNYIHTLLCKSIEGEVLTLVVAGLYHLFLSEKTDYEVEVHPVNQSGASSKEISDLDIYRNGILYIANELKDKHFENTDIKHAADKVIESGGSQLLFIVGPHGNADYNNTTSLINEYVEKRFLLRIISTWSFIDMMITLIEDADAEKYIRYMISTALATKFKEDVINHILKVANSYFDTNFAD